MAKDKSGVTVKPVEGFFINGVPHVVQTVPDDVADALVATGAFEHGGRATKAAAEVGGATEEAVDSAGPVSPVAAQEE